MSATVKVFFIILGRALTDLLEELTNGTSDDFGVLFIVYNRSVNPGGFEGRDPQILGRGSWVGREALLHLLIMYRKYVQKW